MPRIFDSSNAPIDYCKFHMPTETVARARHYFLFCDAEVTDSYPDPNAFDFEAQGSHPPYAGEEYDCFACGRRLTNKDNGEGC